MNFHTADGVDYYEQILKECSMISEEEMFLWLDENSAMLEKEGNLLYLSFKDEFNLDKDSARTTIHAWDAKKRNIPPKKSRR